MVVENVCLDLWYDIKKLFLSNLLRYLTDEVYCCTKLWPGT